MFAEDINIVLKKRKTKSYNMVLIYYYLFTYLVIIIY